MEKFSNYHQRMNPCRTKDGSTIGKPIKPFEDASGRQLSEEAQKEWDPQGSDTTPSRVFLWSPRGALPGRPEGDVGNLGREQASKV